MARGDEFERLVDQRIKERRESDAREAQRSRDEAHRLRMREAVEQQANEEARQRRLPIARAERERTLEAAQYAARVLRNAGALPNARLTDEGWPFHRRVTLAHGWMVKRDTRQVSFSECIPEAPFADRGLILTRDGNLVEFTQAFINDTYERRPGYSQVIRHSMRNFDQPLYEHNVYAAGDEQWVLEALAQTVANNIPEKS